MKNDVIVYNSYCKVVCTYLQAPPRPSRRQGGWADDTPKEKKKG